MGMRMRICKCRERQEGKTVKNLEGITVVQGCRLLVA